MKCIHCNEPVENTVKTSEGSTGVRHALCPVCKKVADVYAICQKELLKDLLLFKPEAFTHLVFNATYTNTLNVLLLRLFLILVNTLDRVSTSAFCIKDMSRSMASQIVEFLLLFTLLQRFLRFQKTLYITTALSTFSVLKIFISFSTSSISHVYYQMCNIIVLLMTSKAISTLLLCSNTTSLSMVIVLRMVSTGFFYSKFQI
ncbi:hypothetical protein NEMIN01_1282 [Nematocida minor]|uniref:uncharacterized protein n=1 Tax=Nematocida minor TaxID=1912983 RepID=UPI002220A60C|nr:uncharacterized protein NEMIN01_1282 [Nematocida minor]KAI5190949.1 hypothetical protein NEMIN01_1282 [Nematocida minor]